MGIAGAGRAENTETGSIAASEPSMIDRYADEYKAWIIPAVFVYFLPSIVAEIRKKENKNAIMIINTTL